MVYQSIYAHGTAVMTAPLYLGNPTGDFLDNNIPNTWEEGQEPPKNPTTGGHILPRQTIKELDIGVDDYDAVNVKQLKIVETKIDNVIQNVNNGDFMGPTGADGPTGPKGIKGDGGVQGHYGDKGAPGDQGPTGQKGEKGSDGTNGISGKKLRFWFKITSTMATSGKIEHPDGGLLNFDDWVVYCGGSTKASWVSISENWPEGDVTKWGYKVPVVDTYILIIAEPRSWYE